MFRGFSFRRTACAAVAVILIQPLAVVAGIQPSAAEPAPGFTPVSPFRVWDSRFGPGPVGRVEAGGSRAITVIGMGGVPAGGVSAVVLNITAVNPTTGTFITVWPTGEPRPTASNLNLPAGDVRPNLVTVKVAGSQVSVYNDSGTVDLIADVSGWYGATGARRYNPVSPSRIWDSRVGPGPVGRLGAGNTAAVQVVGRGGVPAEGVAAVALNVTAVNPTASTFVTAWPSSEAKPLASNLNIPPGDTRPNLVIVKTIDLGHGTSDNGLVSFYNDAGTVDIIVDVAGYFITNGDNFNTTSPTRIWDSRVGPGPLGRVGPADSRDITVAGASSVPATGVTAVVMNVTSVAPSAGTYVTVWPAGEPRPTASNLNIPPGDTRANLVIVKLGAGGKVSFYNDAGTNDLIADVAGWFSSPP